MFTTGTSVGLLLAQGLSFYLAGYGVILLWLLLQLELELQSKRSCNFLTRTHPWALHERSDTRTLTGTSLIGPLHKKMSAECVTDRFGWSKHVLWSSASVEASRKATVIFLCHPDLKPLGNCSKQLFLYQSHNHKTNL